MKKPTNIIIFHGWGSAPDRWSQVASLLESSDRKVYIPTLPGFDVNKPSTTPLTIEDYARWLDNFISEKNALAPIIIGHSNGGRVALYYLSHYKTPVSRLILVDSAGIPPKNQLKRQLFGFLARTGKSVINAVNNKPLTALSHKLLYKLAGESDYINATPIMKKTMKNLLEYDASPDLKKIPVPTQIIWGKKDADTPFWMGQYLASHIPVATLTVLDTGHNPHREDPMKLANVINEFINR